VVMVLVDLLEKRLCLLLDLGLVARLALRLVVGEEYRLELLGRDGSAIVRVHDLEGLPQSLLRIGLADCRHDPAAAAAGGGAEVYAVASGSTLLSMTCT